MNDAALETMHRRFADSPLLVFWETTKACLLACKHCRASAQREPLPGELTTDEGRQLIGGLANPTGPSPILILTGGDCLMRTDIPELVQYAREKEVAVALSPSVTPKLKDEELLKRLREAGVRTVSISLDGCDPGTHDAIRGIPGHFDETIGAIARMKELGFSVQVNTTVMRKNATQMADIFVALQWLGVKVWEVFFLISTGRGVGMDDLTSSECEDVCHFLVDASQFGVTIRTVEAPFFRRVAVQRLQPDATKVIDLSSRSHLYDQLSRSLQLQAGDPVSAPLLPTVATRDGLGIVFVAHNGDVYPSGFLPLAVGNVREEPLIEIYRNSRLLKSIRAAEFPGYCGACKYAKLCGGSRARAYASSGDPLGDDPACLMVTAQSA